MNAEGNTKSEVITTIRLARDQYDGLKRIAALEDRSLSGELRNLIRERIASYERTPDLDSAA